ncbi:MAG: hypothetical protein K2N74_06420, partial [Clostridiales bacterium]|nr:hypothetical protein [Clostridiales bacterium]
LEYRKDGTTAWTTTKPTTAGKYYARPYITEPNKRNYEIDYTINNCETPFERLKNPVAVPYFTNSSVTAADINGTVTTVQYSGDWQDFDLINDPITGKLIGVTAGGRTGGLSYSTLTEKYRARNVGEYTVTSYLSDNGSNTRWADSASNSATTRVTTLKITKRELKVTFADDTITSWNNGERTDIKINVTGVIPGENVKLHVYYKDAAGNMTDVPESAMIASGTDIDVTVDVTTLPADQKYELYVELKSGVSANQNYTIKPSEAEFKFFILKATISELDIAWKYDNAKTGPLFAAGTEHIAIGAGTDTLTGADVQYNGVAYTAALDDTKLPSGLNVTYTNEVQTNVLTTANGGPFYKTTATISAQSGYE